MPAVQLHCPHCGGLFQIDDSLAGQHVACPLCASVVAIPDLAPPLPPGDAPGPAPLEYAAGPALDEAFQLGCPTCGGLFQATRSMAGQEISCPHCYRAVLLPDFEAPDAAAPQGAYAPSVQPSTSDYAVGAAAYPPDPAPPLPDDAGYYETAAASGIEEVWDPRAPRLAAELAWTREAETAAPTAPTWGYESPLSPAHDYVESPADLLPPGAGEPLRPAHFDKPPAELPSEPPRRAHDEIRLPQPAPEPASLAADDVESLLPPGVGSPSVAAAAPARDEVEELLPPTVEPSRNPSPRDFSKPGGGAEGPLLVPTDDGQLMSLQEPTVKTLAVGGRTIELKRLSPEEKERRRLRRSLIAFGFGVIFLIVTMLVATLWRS